MLNLPGASPGTIMDAPHRLRFWLLAGAVALTLWGLIGTFRSHVGYTDALYWPDYTIPYVAPGGVLEEAGFQPGDSVLSVEGIPVTTLGMYSRWPRSLARRPGESVEMVVERDGRLVTGAVVYRERPPGVAKTSLVVVTVALSFLWLGMWSLFTTPTSHASRLAIIGLVVAVGLPGPNLGTWNGVKDHIQVASEVLWAILVLRVFLRFPVEKRAARSRLAGIALWAPWLVLLGCLGVELAYHPRFYHSFGGFVGLLLLAYVVLALAAVGHTWATLSRAELRASGMGFVLLAILVAVVPNLVAIAGWLVPPGFDTPGQGAFPYLVALIPVGMALGVRREARSESGPYYRPSNPA